MCVHEETYKGYQIKIESDDDPMNPMENCDYPNGFGLVMRNNAVIDPDAVSCDDWAAWFTEHEDHLDHEELKAVKKFDREHVWLPVYKFEHSGVAYNTTGFSCPWDSGLVGVIYLPKSTARKEWGMKPRKSAKEYNEAAESYLRSILQTYSDYVSGNVYGYVITPLDAEGEPLEDQDDSVWGFIGDYDDYCLKEARSQVDAYVKAAA